MKIEEGGHSKIAKIKRNMVRRNFNGLLQPGKTSQRMTEQISNVNSTQATGGVGHHPVETCAAK